MVEEVVPVVVGVANGRARRRGRVLLLGHERGGGPRAEELGLLQDLGGDGGWTGGENKEKVEAARGLGAGGSRGDLLEWRRGCEDGTGP